MMGPHVVSPCGPEGCLPALRNRVGLGQQVEPSACLLFLKPAAYQVAEGVLSVRRACRVVLSSLSVSIRRLPQ